LIVYVKQSQKKSDFAFFDCDFAYLFLLRVWQERAPHAAQQRKTFGSEAPRLKGRGRGEQTGQ
jgi:hypothetical protein